FNRAASNRNCNAIKGKVALKSNICLLYLDVKENHPNSNKLTSSSAIKTWIVQIRDVRYNASNQLALELKKRG
ncbi:hypothetical protein, partial [Richelia intracellularis]|uniref:hypothetical protein n=1 Tax=Richelia intracellularis TaxID=1164990 RepID=UPI0005C59D47